MRWPTAPLGKLLALEYGSALPARIRDGTGRVPVAGSNGLSGYHSSPLVSGPGIVVGRKGSAGKVVWYDSDFWPIDTTYYVKTKVNLRWIFYLLNHLRLEQLAIVTGVPGLNREDAYRLKVDLPPPSEQQLIVNVLDQADTLRRLRAEAYATARRILPALFFEMFGEPTNNPRGLRKKPLGEVIKVKSGSFLPSSAMDPTGTYPVYGGNGIAGYHTGHMFDERKIVIGRVGVYCGVVHYSEPKSWVTDNALYVSEMAPDTRPRYLVEAIRLANLNQYAGRAGQPLISGGRIYPVKILIPEPEEQELFAKRAFETDRLLIRQEESSSILADLQTNLFYRAFTGELTARWREGRKHELLREMEEQAKALGLSLGDLDVSVQAQGFSRAAAC